MELFDLLLRIGPLHAHVGLAWGQPAAEGSEDNEPEPAGPMPHLEPVDAPTEVVITENDSDPELQPIGFQWGGVRRAKT